MIGNNTLQVEAPRQIKKPALFIRNVRKIGSANVLAVMNQMNCDRVRINDKSKDVQSDLAVAFFPTEESAFQALHKLKTLRVEGVKIAVSFRLILFFSLLSLFLFSLFCINFSFYFSFSSICQCTISAYIPYHLSLLFRSHNAPLTHFIPCSLRTDRHPSRIDILFLLLLFPR